MKVLNFNEVKQVSGAGAIGDTIGCAVAVGAIFASEGVALVIAPAAALGACANMAETLYAPPSDPNADPYAAYDYDGACHMELPPPDYEVPIYY